MPGERNSKERRVRMFAAVNRDGRIRAGHLYYFAGQVRDRVGRDYRGIGDWARAKREGWRVVPVIVTLPEDPHAP